MRDAGSENGQGLAPRLDRSERKRRATLIDSKINVAQAKGPLHARSVSKIMRAVAIFLVVCAHATCALAEARSPLCSLYDGSKTTDDPIYLNEFSKAKESSAISCVQRTAIRLSSGPETADSIANAAVSACNDEATREANQLSSKDENFDKVLAGIRSTMKRSALVAIMTMRAGRC
jgi:hypothetical protein